MTYLIILSQLLIFLAKTVDFTYLFQIKEYRFDRVYSYLKEKSILRALYAGDLRLPAYKMRNYLIIGATMILLPFLFILLQPFDLPNLIIITAIIPIASFANTALWVGITQIIAHIKRGRIIAQAKKKLSRSNAKIIAISGTYGKSSIKEFLEQILTTTYHVAKTDKNMNTDVGVALSLIKNLKKNTQYFIAEMGAYRIGEVDAICRFVRPDYAILTSSGNQHIDIFGSQENLITAESEHLGYVPEQGSVYINKDIPGIEKKLSTLNTKKIVLFSWRQPKTGDIQISSLRHHNGKMHACITYKNEEINIETKLLGDHVIQNLLPCIALARDLGLSACKISQAVQHLQPVRHKLSLHKGIDGSTILSDCNNSNVEGFIQALRVGNSLKQKKKIIMTKGIIELGKEKKPSYQRIMKELEKTSLTLYTTDKDFLPFETKKSSIKYYDKEEDMIGEIINVIDKNTLLIIEGRFKKTIIDIFIV